jgi:hypothetical protein
MPHVIPQMVRGVDPQIPKQVLQSRLKTIDKRRAEIETLLGQGNGGSYRAQELHSELEDLGNARYECEQALNPPKKAALSPALKKLYAEQKKRDIANLRTAIRQQTEQAEHAADKEASAGNHRQAKLIRMSILEIPQTCCREGGYSVALLAEIDL